MSNYPIQKKATEFRLSSGIGTCEPIRLKSWLLKLNVIAYFRDMGRDFSGMAIKHGDFRFILINSKHSLGRQHFTVAHELYHLFIQEDFSSMVCSIGKFSKKDKTEYEADWFAAYLLLPDECVLSMIPESELGKNKITLPTIVKIEQYFACSRFALLYRLDNMGLINFESYRKYTEQVRNSALSLGYDKKLYESGNSGLMIGDYGERAYRLFEKDVISESHFLSLMKDIGIDIENEKMRNEQAVI
jgi:Zn-dependent peptidase ImmA (M78 family)